MKIMPYKKAEPDAFTDFMKRLMAVPHSEIKAALEAKKEAKKTSSSSASRDSGVSSKTRSSQA